VAAADAAATFVLFPVVPDLNDFFGRNPQPGKKSLVAFRVAFFKNMMPFFHLIFSQPDLFEHINPIFFGQLMVHDYTAPLYYTVLVSVTAMTMTVLKCEPVDGSSVLFSD
jgi:hypothetical protein